jgi:hypothetical protein
VDRAERVEAVRTRIGEAKAHALAVREHAPGCHQCTYGAPDGLSACRHPAYSRFKRTAFLGTVHDRGEYPATKDARSDGGLCGPEGLLFEDMPVLQRLCVAMYREPALTIVSAIAALWLIGYVALRITGQL